MDIKGTCLNIIKVIYDKLTANIILSGEKLKTFFSKIKNKNKVSTFATIIQHSFGSPSHGHQWILFWVCPKYIELRLKVPPLGQEYILEYFKGPPSGSLHVSTSQSVRCCYRSTSATASACPLLSLPEKLLASISEAFTNGLYREGASPLGPRAGPGNSQTVLSLQPARISQSVMKAA